MEFSLKIEQVCSKQPVLNFSSEKQQENVNSISLAEWKSFDDIRQKTSLLHGIAPKIAKMAATKCDSNSMNPEAELKKVLYCCGCLLMR